LDKDEQIANLKLTIKRLREQYDRVYEQARLSRKYKRDRDDAREECERLKKLLEKQ
jgi:hypothetical protein